MHKRRAYNFALKRTRDLRVSLFSTIQLHINFMKPFRKELWALMYVCGGSEIFGHMCNNARTHSSAIACGYLLARSLSFLFYAIHTSSHQSRNLNEIHPNINWNPLDWARQFISDQTAVRIRLFWSNKNRVTLSLADAGVSFRKHFPAVTWLTGRNNCWEIRKWKTFN